MKGMSNIRLVGHIKNQCLKMAKTAAQNSQHIIYNKPRTKIVDARTTVGVQIPKTPESKVNLSF